MTWYTVNAIDYAGNSYPLYLECETVDQVERIVELLGLILDEAGVCEMEYIVDRRSN